jgi:hypothetical protein
MIANLLVLIKQRPFDMARIHPERYGLATLVKKYFIDKRKGQKHLGEYKTGQEMVLQPKEMDKED